MVRHYTRWTKELLEPVVQSSQSYAECLKKLGLRVVGGNYSNLQRNIDKFNISTDHMLHQAHNKGKDFVSFENAVQPATLKRKLLKELGHVCQSCGAKEWLDHPVPLELEHLDGNNRNNSRENLTLLCCNCHALTPTWRNRRR